MDSSTLFFSRKSIIIAILAFSLGAFMFSGIALAQNSEDELFLVAQKAFEDGFHDVAIRYIDQLLLEYPQTDKKIQAQLLLGQCYFFKNQYLKAYDIFNDLLAYPELKDVTLFWLGETYLKGADYNQAQKQYEQLIQLYPKSTYIPQAYYSLGWLFYEKNDFDKASGYFQSFLKNYPDHQLAEDAAFKLGETSYNSGRYTETIDHFKNFILHYPNSTRHAQAYFYIAESYYYLNDPLTAATYYAQTAEIAYDNKLILMAKVSLGWSYLKLEKISLAEKYFDEAAQFSEEKGIPSADVFLGQATLYSESKQFDLALKAYTQLIERFPKSPRISEALLGKSNILYLKKMYAEAIAAYQEIIDQFSTDPANQDLLEKAYFGLAWAYLKKGDIDASVKSFETIKNKTENNTVKISALTQIGDAYQDINKLEQAIDVYDQILEEYPDSPYTDYVQYRQGIALLKLERIESATLSFQSLQANFPNSKYLTDVNYYLAVAYFKKGDWSIARDQILDFIETLPKDNEFLPEAHYILAFSYFNLEDYKNALKTFRTIIKNYPYQKTLVRNSEISIAKCYFKLNDVAEALKRFDALIYKYPLSSIAEEAYLWMGDYYLEINDFDKATHYYTQLIANFPGSPKKSMAFFELSKVFRAQGEYDKAINALKNVDDTEDELYAKAKIAIGEIFSQELDTASALETYEKIIETTPEFKRDAYVKIANVYEDIKEYTKAIQAYTRGLQTPKGRSQHTKAELQFYIADKYEWLSKSKIAVEEYLKIPYLYPDETAWIIKAYLRVARIFEDAENWTEAVIIYKKILPFKTDEGKFAQERLDWIKENTPYKENPDG